MGRPARDLLATLLLRDATAFALACELPAALAGFPPGEAAPALLARIAQARGGLDRFRSLRALNQLRRAHPGLPLDKTRLAEAVNVELAAASKDRALRIAGERLSIAGDGNPAGRLLLELLQDKETRALERVFRTLDLLLPGRQVERAFRGTQSGSREQRETAKEVVLELLPGRWRDGILQLLEAPRLLPLDSRALLRLRLTPESFVISLLRQRSELVRMLARRLARDRRWFTASADGTAALSAPLEVSDD
jgi:hypothetical protein